MIAENNTTITKYDGMTLGHGGTKFMPEGKRLFKSSHATYERNGRFYGVSIEDRDGNETMRFTPAWQLPYFARDRRDWGPFSFGDDVDDICVELHVDFKDGEVSYRCDVEDTDLDAIGALIDSTLDRLDAIWPSVLAYVGERYRAMAS